MLGVAGVAAMGCSAEPDPMLEEEEEATVRDTAYRHGTPPGGPPWTYFLTAYGGGNDSAYFLGTPACGGKPVDGKWYYATGAFTFGCRSRLRLEANGKCVVVEVMDNGPASWVERKAQRQCGGTGYVIDASPLAAKHLFGVTSAGWSDCFAIQVTEVAETATPGPVSCDLDLGPSAGPAPETAKSFIGAPCTTSSDCSTGLCLDEGAGFPGGTCSQACDGLCPDQAGSPITFCTTVDGAPRCVSRCDQSRFPMTGCRDGYQCVTMPRWGDLDFERQVCLP